MVTSLPRVSPETYLDTGSSSDSLPSSASMSIAAAVNCLLIEPILYRISGLAGVGGSRRALPDACRYAIFPSLTTASEALGTPVVASTLCTISSTVARNSGARSFCADEEESVSKTMQAHSSEYFQEVSLKRCIGASELDSEPTTVSEPF